MDAGVRAEWLGPFLYALDGRDWFITGMARHRLYGAGGTPVEPKFHVTRREPIHDPAAFQRAMFIMEHRLLQAIRQALCTSDSPPASGPDRPLG